MKKQSWLSTVQMLQVTILWMGEKFFCWDGYVVPKAENDNDARPKL